MQLNFSPFPFLKDLFLMFKLVATVASRTEYQLCCNEPIRARNTHLVAPLLPTAGTTVAIHVGPGKQSNTRICLRAALFSIMYPDKVMNESE